MSRQLRSEGSRWQGDTLAASERERFEREGFLVLRDFEAADRRARLRRIGDRVLEAILAEPEGCARFANGPNIAFLTDPRHHEGRRDELLWLLEWLGDSRIAALIEALGGTPMLFHNTQYFYEPRGRSWPGAWHRDTQFMAPDRETERRRVLGVPSYHFRVALIRDDCLELVPGSHRRFDSDEELAIRGGEDPSTDAMPGRTTIELAAGDACLFHSWMIHRGVYRKHPPRRSFDVIYGAGVPVDWAHADPACIPGAALRAQLGPAARALFEATVVANAPAWRAAGIEWEPGEGESGASSA